MRFGPVGAESIQHLLISNPSIEKILFNNNGLGIGGGQIIANALSEGRAKWGEDYSLKAFYAGRNRLEVEGATCFESIFL